MKKLFSILFLFLSVLASANPLLDMNCLDTEMVCGMDMSKMQDMSCCSDMNHNANQSSPMDMMCCIAPRVVVSNTDLQTEQTQTVSIVKAKKASIIRTKWFNSNYLSDLKFVDTVSVTTTTFDVDGHKYQALDRLSYICIYRI
ncbi:hypothetical protein NWE55_13875 [Myroides albus]|uniref:hypothetical protein n=1 Tax=Myroides albus TaxID=2562892 RepID=UPI002158EC97|nr:hypothetical protein [Myroides albus]UVD79202.1 hypothetical protein NWE55_13875 [Myroides albus]